VKRGVKKMPATLLFPEYDHPGPVRAADLEKGFNKCSLWTGKRKPKIKLPIHGRGEDDYKNRIWHTDLRDFHNGGWIIAWVDDRSRMCLSFRILPNKSSAQTMNAFCEVSSEYLVGHSIETDDGREFEGSCQKV
jgi:hypothetical protein